MPSLHDYANWTVTVAAKVGAVRFVGQRPTEFYDEHFDQRHIGQFQLDVRMALRRQEVLSVLQDLAAGGTVVDIGCGVGDILKAAPARLRRLGVDVAPRSLMLAAKGCPDVGFVCASAYRLPFADESVDAVVCLEVIEHLQDDRAAINELVRILKRGGRLIVSVPNTYYFRSYLRLMGHFRHYNRIRLEALCRSAGLVGPRYLNGYRGVQQIHLYVYALLRLLAMLTGRIRRRYMSVYELHMPCMRTPAYDVLRPAFAWLARRDARRFRVDDRQTFGVFQREL